MFSSILVPLDGSDFSAHALPLARALARSVGARVHLVHVIRPAPDADLKSPQEDLDWKNRIREGAENYLIELAQEMEDSDGADVRTAVLEGRVAPTLGSYAEEHGVSLVAMTTHGTGGLQRWWLGSVADGLLRRGGTNLLLVRPWEDMDDRSAEAPFRHLVVPLDGSDLAEEALGPARALAGFMQAEVTLIRVVPAPMELTSVYGVAGVRVEGEGHRRRAEEARDYLDGLVAAADESEWGSVVLEHRNAAEGVIEGANKAGADLLVLSTHGRGGLARAVLGSVADKVIRGTTLPVLVIRPGDAQGEAAP